MKRTDDLTLAHRLLDTCTFATLSMTEADGGAYCVPISPVRHGDSVFFHCALRGRKVDALRARPNVCLSCVGKAEVIPGKFNIAYESVLAFGTAQEITDDEEKTAALRLICQRYCPDDLWDLPRVLDQYLPATGIWKITLGVVTTKG